MALPPSPGMRRANRQGGCTDMMRSSLLRLLFFSIWTVAFADLAEGATPTESKNPVGLVAMSAHEAVLYAWAHQPTLQAMQARVEVAKRSASLLRAEWLPQLGATAQMFGGTMNNTTAMFLGAKSVDLPRIGASKSGADIGLGDVYPSTLVAVGLRQTLFDFGRMTTQAEVVDREVQITGHRVIEERLALGLQIETSYYAVLAAKAVESVAADAEARATLRRDMVKAGVQRGLRPAIDVTRAEADRTRFEVARLRAHGNVELTQATFAAAVGVPERLLDAVDRESDPQMHDPLLLPLGDAVRTAMEQDPAVQVALQRLLQQQAAIRATTMQWLPTLQLTASLSGRAGGAPTNAGPSGVSGLMPSVPNWDVGVILSVPVFDGQILARRAHSQAQEVVLRYELDAQRRQVLANVQRSYTAFSMAKESLEALGAAAEAARQNYDQASARFRVGLSTSIELADAEALRTEAEMQMVMGRFEVARARAQLNRSIASGL